MSQFLSFFPKIWSRSSFDLDPILSCNALDWPKYLLTNDQNLPFVKHLLFIYDAIFYFTPPNYPKEPNLPYFLRKTQQILCEISTYIFICFKNKLVILVIILESFMCIRYFFVVLIELSTAQFCGTKGRKSIDFCINIWF